MDATIPAVHDSGSSTDVDQSESESRENTTQTSDLQDAHTGEEGDETSAEDESLSGVESLPTSSMEVYDG